MATDRQGNASKQNEAPTEERGRSRQRDQSIRRLVEVFNSDTNEVVDLRVFESPSNYWNPGSLIEEYSLRGQHFLIKTKITRPSHSLWCTPPPQTPKRNPRWKKSRREGRRIKALLLGSPGMVNEVASHENNKHHDHKQHRNRNNNNNKEKRGRGD